MNLRMGFFVMKIKHPHLPTPIKPLQKRKCAGVISITSYLPLEDTSVGHCFLEKTIFMNKQ